MEQTGFRLLNWSVPPLATDITCPQSNERLVIFPVQTKHCPTPFLSVKVLFHTLSFNVFGMERLFVFAFLYLLRTSNFKFLYFSLISLISLFILACKSSNSLSIFRQYSRFIIINDKPLNWNAIDYRPASETASTTSGWAPRKTTRLVCVVITSVPTTSERTSVVPKGEYATAWVYRG